MALTSFIRQIVHGVFCGTDVYHVQHVVKHLKNNSANRPSTLPNFTLFMGSVASLKYVCSNPFHKVVHPQVQERCD